METSSSSDSKLKFQILNWHSCDLVEKIDGDSDSDEEENEKYSIFAFGCKKDGTAVCCRFTGFTPFFYIKVPNSWDETEARKLEKKIKYKIGAFRDDEWRQMGKHLKSCKFTVKKDIYGFNNQKEFKYLRFLFDNESAMKSAVSVFRKHNNALEGKKFSQPKHILNDWREMKFQIYNANVDPILTFATIRKLLMAGWISIDNYVDSDSESEKESVSSNGSVESKNRTSRCKVNVRTHWKNVNPVESNDVAPFLTASFDLECYSYDGMFPDPEKDLNVITQIGTSFQRFGNNPETGKPYKVFQHVAVLGECEPVEGVTIDWYKTEKELLIGWIDLIEKMDPDQFIGYNIANFDWNFLWVRAKKLRIIHEMERLSRLHSIGVVSKFKEDKMESSAHLNVFNFIETYGVNQIDFYPWFKTNTKNDFYTLDHISKTYLGEQKRDVSAKQIFQWSGIETGTPSSRSVVADYCAQDTLLPLRLMDKMCAFPNLIEMAKVTRVPLFWLLTRGQQIKVFSQIFYEAWYNGFLIPTISIKGQKFKGATVLSAQRGVYFDRVSGLDFASLYPSIIIAHNLCLTTWVRLEKYNNIEGVEYRRFHWDNGTYQNGKGETLSDSGDYTFVQNKQGLIPRILDGLWKERKRVKKQMKATDDPFLKMVLNGKQLAIKVSMNSIYGVMGAERGMISCTPIASTTTYMGREMIKHSKKCAEEWYDGTVTKDNPDGIKAIVRYGDSIPGYETVTRQDPETGKAVRVRVDKLLDTEWKPFNRIEGDGTVITKEECRPSTDTYVWTGSGWARLKRIVRHKTHKKIYRVTEGDSQVDVTEDHSLLNEYGEKIKPKDLVPGVTRLLKNPLPE